MAHPIDIIVQVSLVELCTCYGIAAAPLASPSQMSAGVNEPGRVTAAMDCTCDVFTGRLALSVTQELAQASSSRQGGLRPAEADWVRELTNQFVGRIKIRLSRLGIRLNVSLPKTVRGRDGVHDSASPGAEHCVYAFRTLKGDVVVTLTGRFDDRAFDYGKASEAIELPDVTLF